MEFKRNLAGKWLSSPGLYGDTMSPPPCRVMKNVHRLSLRHVRIPVPQDPTTPAHPTSEPRHPIYHSHEPYIPHHPTTTPPPPLPPATFCDAPPQCQRPHISHHSSLPHPQQAQEIASRSIAQLTFTMQPAMNLPHTHRKTSTYSQASSPQRPLLALCRSKPTNSLPPPGSLISA